LEQNSRYLEDGSFIRLKSITLGYTLPKAWAAKVKFENIKVYAMGTNLLLFTKYTGADPESSGSSIPNQDGMDTATPPQPIGIQFGINTTF
jgi:TonB-dependent starch-binding outer membrane protein SusC